MLYSLFIRIPIYEPVAKATFLKKTEQTFKAMRPSV